MFLNNIHEMKYMHKIIWQRNVDAKKNAASKERMSKFLEHAWWAMEKTGKKRPTCKTHRKSVIYIFIRNGYHSEIYMLIHFVVLMVMVVPISRMALLHTINASKMQSA